MRVSSLVTTRGGGEVRSELLVSVVVPTHNRPGRFQRTITGLERQLLDPRLFEIIALDDGAMPASLPQAAACLARRLIRYDSLVERAIKRNRGAEEARGKFLVFSDDDMDVGPEFLQKHLEAQEEFQGAMVFGQILLPTSALKRPGVAFRQRLELTGVPATKTIVEGRPAFGTAANMSIRRDVFLATGGYRKDMVGIEDQDLSIRFTLRGGRLVFQPEALAIHDDEWLDFERFCRRQQWGARCSVRFSKEYPDLPMSRDRDRVQGPIDWSRDRPGLNLRKLAFDVLGRPIMSRIAHEVVSIAESLPLPVMVLERMYRALLGAHLVRGYQEGLRDLASEVKR